MAEAEKIQGTSDAAAGAFAAQDPGSSTSTSSMAAMQALSVSTRFQLVVGDYIPEAPDIYDWPSAQDYLSRELNRISAVVNSQTRTGLQLVELTREPLRPRNGLIVLADGVVWDPGGGRGMYIYNGNGEVWIKLHDMGQFKARTSCGKLRLIGYAPTLSITP